MPSSRHPLKSSSSTLFPQTIQAMTDTFASNTGSLEPQTGFSRIPSVGQAASDLRAAAGEKVAESVQHLRETAGEKAIALKAAAAERAESIRQAADLHWRETRMKAKELHISTEDYIREHPTRCVLGALGLGLLIGLIARR
ncbi:MAG: DUF883 family protein [Verrucomicrobia bacterium]|nr:MAG: DUF883 family protein [Verrucomicrobiota bacterium]TAE89370.1 MAG: DUF883 family protein [Verrucomicrobiota bacterium]TAF27754.1 MAG: DUF883 family protein [Verrucomicrobiota bacterium]TAF42603.1 MAG: DUF883 family protein [Verrucomicrobiota bacterium]